MLFSTTTDTKPTTTQQKNHQNTTTHTTTTTTKIKITQKSKSQRERDRFVGFRRSRRLWVARRHWVEDRWVEGSGSGSKALGSWRDLSSGFAGEVEDWFVGSWVHGAKALGHRRSRRLVGRRPWVEDRWVEALALGRRLWVRGVIWALGLPVKSKIGLWVRGAKALGRRQSRRLVGRRRWALSSSSLSLSLSFSLSVFRKMRFEGKIKTEMILHPNTRSTEKHFRKIYFPCTTKHQHLRKIISGNDLKPKQAQP